MSLKERIIIKVTDILRRSKMHKLYKIKDDSRPVSPFKLVFFCGERGINYLNSSLVSVHKYWETLPEILIITDGTPFEMIESQLVNWPRKLELISWKEAAEHFKNAGNNNLAEYASKDLWGKKFISILYAASKHPSFYSDTDILWFSNPVMPALSNRSILKMGQDVSHCYSDEMLNELQLTVVNERPPLNAGLIFASGDYSGFPKWKELCTYLATKPDNRTEQTSFAILNNYFNENQFFSPAEVLIKIDDRFSLEFTGKKFGNILARHYVNLKTTTFWRDFSYMLIKKSRRKFSD